MKALESGKVLDMILKDFLILSCGFKEGFDASGFFCQVEFLFEP